jgi:putative membrane protein
MYRKIILGTTALAGIMLLAACNQETASNNQPTDQNQTAQNGPAPGSKNEAISAAKDAVAGAVGTIAAELTTSTKGFIDDAAISDMYEVQAGQLAAMRAQSPELKQFAQQMVDAHTQTRNELKRILAKSAPNFMLPMQLDVRRQTLLDDLKGAKDQDFDGRYIAQQINAHQEADILMRVYAKDGDNSEIKVFAAETLPKVDMHLKMIRNIDRANSPHNAQARNTTR